MSHPDPHAPNHHPLGPVLRRTDPDESRQVRRRAVALIVVCLALLSAAWLMHPSPTGAQTHVQAGLPACSWWKAGIPCPTCGMTTAFAHSVRGDWLAAIAAQPAGWLVFVAVAVILIQSVRELATGVGIRVNWYRVSPYRVTAVIAAIVLFAWIYKILATRAHFE